MNRSPQWKAILAPLVALVAMLTLACGDVAAQVRPFAIFGEGIAPEGLPLPGQDARPHWIVGDATRLGPHFGQGSVQTDSAVIDLDHGVITGEFGAGSPFEFIGEDGDRLVTWYGRTDHGASQPGNFELTILDIEDDGSLLVEALFIAEFVAVPEDSTGRFAGVTGSWIMYAWTAPFILGSNDPILYAWAGEGELTYPQP